MNQDWINTSGAIYADILYIEYKRNNSGDMTTSSKAKNAAIIKLEILEMIVNMNKLFGIKNVRFYVACLLKKFITGIIKP